MKNVLIFSLFLAICLITACNSEDSENSESQNDASTDASDTSDATSADAGNQIPKTCESEKDHILGYKQCLSGAIHRVEALKCERMDLENSLCPADTIGASCKSNTDCVEKPDGKCLYDWNTLCKCWYQCLQDSNCKENEICACDGTSDLVGMNSCYPANCKTDADCNGYLCAISSCFDDRGMIRGLYCHTSYDECQGDWDCQNAGTGNKCCYDATIGHWGCYYEED